MIIAHKIDASFSKILYSEIAPTVGLDPIRGGIDIPTFEMHRARLPQCGKRQNDTNRQSSILVDIRVSIYIDSYRLFIFSVQMISYFVSTINASFSVINTCCNFRNFYRFPHWASSLYVL
jgi:hypothetical protein